MQRAQNRLAVGNAFRNWRLLFVVLAVCGLTVSVATRTFRLNARRGITVSCGDTQPMRQHMDHDAVRWVPPIPPVALLQVPTFYPYVAPAGPPLANLLFDKSLYNRPPPLS
jgi:hypothetical protein